jgi:ribulose-phosphate 3-epimerase
MIEIIPSILATTREELKDMIEKVESTTSLVHLDIADGIFVNSKTIGLEEIKSISTNLKFSVHLMVERPVVHASLWLGVPNVESIIFHIETTNPTLVHNDGVNKTQEIIDTVRSAGKKVGIALNPETGLETIESFGGSVDMVQFMTVHPGNYGGEFVEGVLGKVSDFHNRHPGLKIAVDGSIHRETARMAIEAGAEILIMGSHVFSDGRDIGEAINELKNL